MLLAFQRLQITIERRCLSSTAYALTGSNFIAGQQRKSENVFEAEKIEGEGTLPTKFSEATFDMLEEAANLSESCFEKLQNKSYEEIAVFLDSVAENIDALGPDFISRACDETGYADTRINGERDRTTSQLRKFADLIRDGTWVEARIDQSGEKDIRKLRVPLGPVAVFGASNFPLAFSVAGGDTASAWAAKCPVIVKANPCHPGTSEYIAHCITEAINTTSMPRGMFSMLHGNGQIGERLVIHPTIQAVGFTGSTMVGKEIMKAASVKRSQPIPVYCEMGSINPIVILPSAIDTRWEKIAQGLCGSVTLGAGQFCTNPGIVFVVEDPEDSTKISKFVEEFSRLVEQTPPASMLSSSIRSNYMSNLKIAKETPGVDMLTFQRDENSVRTEVGGCVLTVSSRDFAKHRKTLSEEIFGPTTLIVRCTSADELIEEIKRIPGQLTGSIFGSEDELSGHQFQSLVHALSDRVGRIIFNDFPTGVEVCYGMHHGGPFPSSSSPLYTSVGMDAIKRFSRPLSYQDWPDACLPPQLRDDNPNNIYRIINGTFTKDSLTPSSRKE